jgi:hypothetical protein
MIFHRESEAISSLRRISRAMHLTLIDLRLVNFPVHLVTVNSDVNTKMYEVNAHRLPCPNDFMVDGLFSMNNYFLAILIK